MKLTLSAIAITAGLASTGLLISGCQKFWDKFSDHDGNANGSIKFKNYSVNPSLVKAMPGFENVDIFTLISSDDTLTESPNFIFGAQPDGAGLLKDPNSNGYVLIDNHEILRSVSRVYLDKNFQPRKGEYIVDAEGGQWRLCSATMATPQEHGFGPVFLTAGETGPDSRVHAIDPFGAVGDKKRTDRVLPALGRASMENAVPLPKDAFPGKTVILIGEDDGNGQVNVYVSNSVGDLNNGKLYFLKRTNNDPVETNMAVGTTYDVEFVEIDNATTATGVEIAAQSVTKNAIQFARVEDLDYRKGGSKNSREIYFVATGVANQAGKNMWGRMYKLELDKDNPLKGKLQPVADGGINPGNDLINPDNVCATENFVYIQEDGDSYYPDAKHDSYVWIYHIESKQYKPFITMWQRREDAAFNAKYNTVNNNKFGSWEFGAMIDISKTVGVPNTFLLNIHPHTWQEEKFKNADGTTVTGNKEGGQIVILKGVPR
jgi:hypothetical protein